VSSYADLLCNPDLFMNAYRCELYERYRGYVLRLVQSLVNPLSLTAV
jgi:hypothetical protein